jgi:hypothetical protein
MHPSAVQPPSRGAHPPRCSTYMPQDPPRKFCFAVLRTLQGPAGRARSPWHGRAWRQSERQTSAGRADGRACPLDRSGGYGNQGVATRSRVVHRHGSPPGLGAAHVITVRRGAPTRSGTSAWLDDSTRTSSAKSQRIGRPSQGRPGRIAKVRTCDSRLPAARGLRRGGRRRGGWGLRRRCCSGRREPRR